MKIRFLKAMSDCIRDLRDWMIRDRLKLNEDIGRIRKFQSPDDTKLSVHAFITSRLPIATVFCMGCPRAKCNEFLTLQPG